jgi:hypothetical protein
MRPQSPHPRAADDFVTIRTRMEELRRERAQVLAETQDRLAIGPSPYRAASGKTEYQDRLLIPRLIRQLSGGIASRASPSIKGGPGYES